MNKISRIFWFITTILLLVFSENCVTHPSLSVEEIKEYFSGKTFQFEEISGIGFEEGVTRRDNSDIIQVDGKYYIYYTKVYGRSPGYWGTVWAAVSEDEGHSWAEIGEVLGKGAKGMWDSQAVFTPNILVENGTYYLYYTGVQPTPGNPGGAFEDNSVNDFTAIGVAKANNPAGPFVRCENNPVLTVSKNRSAFDSYRVDDAVLVKRDNRFWLYYKGRNYTDGKNGPAHTKMGVASAPSPEGPFKKYEGNPILNKSHEVFLWKQNEGIACLASISSTLEYAGDGIDFTSHPVSVKVLNDLRPKAPGAYRPDLIGEKFANGLTWGVSMIQNGASSYLVRWQWVDK